MTASAPSTQTTASPDLEHPQPTTHSDSEKSRMPERKDRSGKQVPNDHPGKQPGEAETPVG